MVLLGGTGALLYFILFLLKILDIFHIWIHCIEIIVIPPLLSLALVSLLLLLIAFSSQPLVYVAPVPITSMAMLDLEDRLL